MPPLDRFKLILVRIAQGMLFAVPLLWAAWLQIQELVTYHFPRYSFWMTVPLTLTFLGLLFILLREREVTRWRAVAEIGLVLAAGLSLRLLLVSIFSTDPTSDFKDIHEFAVDLATGQGLANVKNYTYIPRVIYNDMPALLLSLVYRLLGPSLRLGKMLMTALALGANVSIYLAARKLWGRHRLALVAAAFFGFLPSLIIYTGIPTPEHAALFLTGLIFWVLASAEGRAPRSRALFALYALAGLLCGLVDWFRPMGMVLIAAVLIAELCLRPIAGGKEWLALAGRVALLLGLYYFTTGLSVAIAERVVGAPVAGNGQRLGESLYIGLYGDGVHSDYADGVIYATIARYGSDFDAINREMIRLAIENVRSHPEATLRQLPYKFAREWANHGEFFELALAGSNDAELAANLKDIDALLTLLILLGALVSLLFSFFTRPTRALFALQLFVLGLSLTLLITEAQNRYPVVLVPALAILATDGYARVGGWLKMPGRR